MSDLVSILAVVLSYLVGSLSFAVIVSRAMGLADPRTFGSKNPGATNVLRSGSKAAAILTLLLDAAKGWVPVFVVHQWGAAHGLGQGTAALCGLAAFVGHLYPVFFKFVGGKGVATALGVLVGLNGWLALGVALVWVLSAAVWRYSSLSSLLAALVAPSLYFLAAGELWVMSAPDALAISAMSALLVYRHSENIGRLIKGKESKLFAKN
jgi:glycerol-3-phosphate acyltransferase PlsY